MLYNKFHSDELSYFKHFAICYLYFLIKMLPKIKEIKKFF